MTGTVIIELNQFSWSWSLYWVIFVCPQMAFRVVRLRREARRTAKLEEIFTVSKQGCQCFWYFWFHQLSVLLFRFNIFQKSKTIKVFQKVIREKVIGYLAFFQIPLSSNFKTEIYVVFCHAQFFPFSLLLILNIWQVVLFGSFKISTWDTLLKSPSCHNTLPTFVTNTTV